MKKVSQTQPRTQVLMLIRVISLTLCYINVLSTLEDLKYCITLTESCTNIHTHTHPHTHTQTPTHPHTHTHTPKKCSVNLNTHSKANHVYLSTTQFFWSNLPLEVPLFQLPSNSFHILLIELFDRTKTKTESNFQKLQIWWCRKIWVAKIEAKFSGEKKNCPILIFLKNLESLRFLKTIFFLKRCWTKIYIFWADGDVS